MTAYNFKPFQEKLKEAEDWLGQELRSIQTGRATPAMLDSVRVDSYGAKMKIEQLASVAIEDARTLRIAPWDIDNLRAIEVAIRDADLGLGVSVDDKGIRVSFPELTGETREKYLKIIGDRLEDARVSVRTARDDVWAEIQQQEKDGEIGEDEKFRLKNEMERMTKDTNTHLEEIAERKERDIQG